MNGAGHFEQAVTILGFAGDPTGSGYNHPELIARAQVHATLALTMAVLATRAIGPEEMSGYRTILTDWEPPA